jgi:phosphoribosylglycinamide formyltransferase-1
MKRIAILASGSGSNAEQICRHFAVHPATSIAWIGTNNPEAGVIARARRLGIPCHCFTRDEFRDENGLVEKLKSDAIDMIVLAGFLWLVPPVIVQAFRGRILNIHPSLLPDFGGKGFYGDNVHRAVLEAGRIMSGITIHQVNEHFDEGHIVFQAACHIEKGETTTSLAAKIHQLEHRYFPTVIEKYLDSTATV